MALPPIYRLQLNELQMGFRGKYNQKTRQNAEEHKAVSAINISTAKTEPSRLGKQKVFRKMNLLRAR